jgi:copper chaperone CopZ
MPEFPAAAPPVHSENGAEDAQALAVTPSAKEREPPFWAATSSESEKEGLREPAKGKYTPLSERRDNGENKELPECKRKTPVAGKLDWLTLPRTDFNICLDCYGGVFANTHYKSHFQPMIRPTDKLIACDFGASPWYRIAWLLTLKYNTSDLRCFIQVSSVATSLKNQPCPGNRKVSANWLTIKDPMKRRAVSNFTVCLHCAKTVEALLPNLRGVFVSLDSRSEPSRSVCSLHYTPQRKRFALYFDTLESTADRALRKNESPNIERLASKLEKLTYVEECREDSPVSDGYWHVMQFLPEFTVCGECFDEVVRPRLNDENIISRNFYMEPQRLAVATCQLYSTRMREVFKKACRRNDPDYLEAKVLERLHVEADIHAKLVKLDRAGHDEAWTEEQVAKLIKEWKRWE